MSGRPSPLLLQSGWTDALFPVGQALGAYDHIRKLSKGAPVALQIGDLGHSPAGNHPRDIAAFDAAGLRFFNAWLKGGRSSDRGPGSGSSLIRTGRPQIDSAQGRSTILPWLWRSASSR